jgi:hypothetical protein
VQVPLQHWVGMVQGRPAGSQQAAATTSHIIRGPQALFAPTQSVSAAQPQVPARQAAPGLQLAAQSRQAAPAWPQALASVPTTQVPAPAASWQQPPWQGLCVPIGPPQVAVQACITRSHVWPTGQSLSVSQPQLHGPPGDDDSQRVAGPPLQSTQAPR